MIHLARMVQENVEKGIIKNRIRAARAYANVIFISQKTGEMDVADLNAAIEKRWSRSGLEFIKTKAWKIYQNKEV